MKLKKLFYFPVAAYFRFFASLQLSLWRPRIIVITGSSGKTTLLHLVESQLGETARYSHHANSAFGIPFDILGLKRTTLLPHEWIFLFLSAPFKALKRPYSQKIYVVEADCDRPGEGQFLSTLLNPEVTLWVSASRTHSANFDQFPNVEKRIAEEFGYFLRHTQKLALINGDSELIAEQAKKTTAEVKKIKKAEFLDSYIITEKGTEFTVKGQKYTFPYLLPEGTFYSLAMTQMVTDFVGGSFDPKFSHFQQPPSRSSIFKGIKNTTLIDSSYNATLDGMTAILNMFEKYPATRKWVVIGDMIEQGKVEQEEHERLADLLSGLKLDKIILMGPRVSEYTYPHLHTKTPVEKFTTPTEALTYLQENITGRETILFKGARFLEGVIEHLLANPEDAKKLCRREKVWQERRKKWGL